ncbi:MAG: hypothetical protein JWO45_641 [Spartobacteria bacterium]|nr:hypothetical protein [Spartobacteria bacterium]
MPRSTPFIGGIIAIAGLVLFLSGIGLIGGAILIVGIALFILGWSHFHKALNYATTVRLKVSAGSAIRANLTGYRHSML